MSERVFERANHRARSSAHWCTIPEPCNSVAPSTGCTNERGFDEDRIVAVLVALAEGEVVSYGDVAHDAGFPGRARAVGSLLSATDLDLPWWRVVRSDGRLATDPAAGQAALLREEGVTIRAGRVVDAPVGRFHRPERRPEHRF